MKKFLLYGLFAILLCGIGTAGADAPRLRVLTTLFPITDFARTIGGGHADVSSILPPGAEPHSYSPSPADIMKLKRADVFLYASDEMETWIPRLLTAAPPDLKAIAVAPPPDDEGGEGHSEEEEDDDGHHHHARDPHVWLDPLQAIDMARRIEQAFTAADPANADAYKANADALCERLLALHREIESTLKDCPDRTIMAGGHFAFGHFANRYGLAHVSPYPGFAPNAQPSPRAIAQMIKTMREQHTRALFYEEILDPKLSRMLAGETGAVLLPLYSMHNLSTADVAASPSYFDLMRRNLDSLQRGLCAE